MSQKNETVALILSFLVTGGILGGGAWFLFNGGANFFNNSGNNSGNANSGNNNSGNNLNPNNNSGNTTSNGSSNSSNNSSSNSSSNSGNNNSVNSNNLKISSGGQALIPAPSPEKVAAAAAFAQGDYSGAVTNFSAALAKNKNDPESLIYLNNAKIGNNKSLTIAVSAPIGADPNVGQEILRGIAQAQNQVNQSGGINGVPLKVIIADDRDNAGDGEAIARSLISNPEVLAVVGNFSSGVTLATGKVYENGKLVLISPTSTAVQISGLSRYVFRTVPSDRFSGDALARYMLNNLKKQKVAVFFNSQSDYSKSIKDVFTTAVFGSGGLVVKEFDLTAAGFNANQAVRDAVAQGAEVIMFAANTGAVDQVIQVAQANTNPVLPMLGSDGMYNGKTLQAGQQSVNGLVLAVAWHILGNPEAAFPREATQLWGGEVNWRSAMTFDATRALIAALGTSPSREGVQSALASPDFRAEGAANEIRFLPSGDRNQAIQLVKVQQGTRTAFGYEFVPVTP
jgi:branched-chain amino acid transport system substrate-binding protein